jgi:hypothetical protein
MKDKAVMRPPFGLLCASATVALLVLVGAAEASDPSYPLICRGGGRLAIVNNGSGGVQIKFQRTAGGIDAGLRPGQCTWVDRAVHFGEPNKICDQATRAAGYVSGLVLPGNYITLQVANNFRGCMVVSRAGF